ncbi:MAG: hypothetical protein JJ916_04200 [Phycisphaerales bacterium]|nr:hypothetical protein [Phycisphaerales bacterium]
MSTLGPPDLPASLALYNATATISTPDYGTLSNSGMPTRTLGSTESNVPCRLDTITPGQALKYGYVVDETAFRMICPIRKEDGSDLRIDKNQYVTIGGVQYMTLGAGRQEGMSGEQTAILKKEDR